MQSANWSTGAWEFVEQAQSGCVFALAGLQPFDGQEAFAGLLTIWHPTARC
jgi:hypothetical protein